MPIIDHQEALKLYQARGHRRVDGWLKSDAIEIISAVATVQDSLGLRGSIAEIGIHHGQLFILLCLLARLDAPGYAYDLFEAQDENRDRSGWGRRELFFANLRRHRCSPNRVTINTCNSLRLTPDDIRRQVNLPARLFSVDAGHRAENTYHDLSLASAGLCRGGILILDDYFNPSWPGVSEGAMRYFIEHPHTLFPVVIGGNKMLLTNDPAWANTYREQLSAIWRPWCLEHSEFLGTPTLVFSRRDRIGRRLKHSRLGRRLVGSKRIERLRQLQRRLFGG